MKLAAEVVDRFTKPMRAMRDALIRLAEDTKKTHAAGAKDATKHAEAFGDLGKTIAKVDERMRSSLTPTLAAFGVTTLTVAGAVATLEEHRVRFRRDNAPAIVSQSRNRVKHSASSRARCAFASLDMSPGACAKVRASSRNTCMICGLDSFPNCARGKRRYKPALVDFVRGISQLPIDEALSKALGELGHIRDQHEKRTFLQLLGVAGKSCRCSRREIRKLMADIRKNIGVLGPVRRRTRWHSRTPWTGSAIPSID